MDSSPHSALQLQRSVGRVRVVLGARADRPQLVEGYQEGAGRLRFPRVAAGMEAMILNTSGGLAAGDRFDLEAEARASRLTVSTQACERVYRSEDGDAALLSQRYRVHAGAALRALPQPTIVFDRAHLRRRTAVEIEAGANLTLVEALVFGRAAMGEAIHHAKVHDRLEVHRDGALAFVDALFLGPDTFAAQENPASLAGARGTALVVHQCAGEAGRAVTLIREAGAGEGVRVGASAVSGLAVGRLLASSHLALHSALARIVQALDDAPVPRTWAL